MLKKVLCFALCASVLVAEVPMAASAAYEKKSISAKVLKGTEEEEKEGEEGQEVEEEEEQ